MNDNTPTLFQKKLVGRGSYGSVYRGKLKESKMEVTVKVFSWVVVTPRVTKSLIKSLKLQLSLKARANQVVEV
jgi:hypothetical protein